MTAGGQPLAVSLAGMNGPDHYREAEQALARYARSVDPEREQLHLLEAQVHATLALAAATATQSPHGGVEMDDAEWSRALRD